MPTVPLRFCAEPGCPEKVANGRCPTHQRTARTLARRFQHGATAYNSAAWVRTSRAFRATHPFCANPGKATDCTLLTDVTDHIVPHRGDATLFWDAHNWQPLCWTCHSRKTARETTWTGVGGIQKC